MLTEQRGQQSFKTPYGVTLFGTRVETRGTGNSKSFKTPYGVTLFGTCLTFYEASSRHVSKRPTA